MDSFELLGLNIQNMVILVLMVVLLLVAIVLLIRLRTQKKCINQLTIDIKKLQREFETQVELVTKKENELRIMIVELKENIEQKVENSLEETKTRIEENIKKYLEEIAADFKETKNAAAIAKAISERMALSVEMEFEKIKKGLEEDRSAKEELTKKLSKQEQTDENHHTTLMEKLAQVEKKVREATQIIQTS